MTTGNPISLRVDLLPIDVRQGATTGRRRSFLHRQTRSNILSAWRIRTTFVAIFNSIQPLLLLVGKMPNMLGCLRTRKELSTRLGFLLAASVSFPTLRCQTYLASKTSRATPFTHHVRRDFAGKRVGVIGTGATGIQTITAISKELGIESLSVFQRNPTWVASFAIPKYQRTK